MVRMSTLVVLLRHSDRKLSFYASESAEATELIIMLYLSIIFALWHHPPFQARRTLV